MRLSVVIPAYNEAGSLPETILSATAAIRRSVHFEDAEIVVADDGSTDGTAEAALAAEDGVPVRVERLPENSGRFIARRQGLEAADGEYVLFLDAGVTVNEHGLRFVGDELEERGADVWNAHTLTNTDGNPLGHFWGVVSSLAFPDYLREPRTTSLPTDFDRFPKGTTCFFAPRELLREACRAFRRAMPTRGTRTTTPRCSAALRSVGRSTSRRASRASTPPGRAGVAFVRHAVVRGVVFLDGHGRRESRFFPAGRRLLPAQRGGRRHRRAQARAGAAAAPRGGHGGGTAAARTTTTREAIVSFAVLAPVYAVAHGTGMWKGLAIVGARPAARHR